jgi:DNA-binding transcriptional LysR family regulator
LEPGTPTFDQLAVLLAVAEAGSLAAAGRRLGRATSAMSYAIDNLEGQLGVVLFERSATRRPQLTQAGQVVLAQARALAGGMDTLRAKVRGLTEGLEAEVSVAFDVMFPSTDLVGACQAFQAAFPTVNLRLHIEALGAPTQMVLDGAAVLAVSGPLSPPDKGLDLIQIAGFEMVPVAAPCHPLAQPGQTPGALRDHVQLVLSDRSTLTQGRDFAVFGLNTWRMSDLGAKHALLRAGLGWGNMPIHMVADDLAVGRLTRLDLPDWRGGDYPLHIVFRTAAPPGPAGRWLIERLRA